MNKPWKVVFVFVGVFLAGAISGGLVTARFTRFGHFNWRQSPRPQIMQRLEKELELTGAQKEKILPVVQRAMEETQRLRRENIKGIAAVMDRMHTEVGAELTPEQKVKLDEMRKRFHERAERVRGEFRERDRDRASPSRP